MTEKDSIHGFDFERFPVRGKLAHLDASWQAVLELKDYPPAVRELLGQALAASVLLASTLKLDGRLTVQFQGDGPLSLLLSQCTGAYRVRGLAHWDTLHGSPLEFSDLLGGRMAITLEPSGEGRRYQGIIPLEKNSLAANMEAYFVNSEQLPTRLWFASNQQKVVGMLLQKMPAQSGEGQTSNQDVDAWPRVQMLADTITADELLSLSDAQILRRLFNEEDLRLFDSAPISFSCSCSLNRIHVMLQGLGEKEVFDIIREQGFVGVDCEFCGRHYQLDAIDAKQLFTNNPADISYKTH